MAELEKKRLTVALWNHPGATGIVGDLRKTWPEVVRCYREQAGSERLALLAACPPCQGMSSAKGRRGLMEDADSGMIDERNLLVLPIAEVAWALRPRVIVVENVPAFLQRKVRHPRNQQPISAARLLVEYLAPEYAVFPFSVDLCDYGVPQTRKRSFLTFVHRDEPGLRLLLEHGLAPYPAPTHAADHGGRPPITLKEALKALNKTLKLRPLTAKSIGKAKDPKHPLHEVPVWDYERYQMVATIPPNSGATAWENNECPNPDCAHIETDGEAAVCSVCHQPLRRPIMAGAEGRWRLIKGFRTSSYKRMDPNQPAATITTATGHVGSHSTIHPSAARVLSTLECAHLQTFPIDFVWRNAIQRWGHTNVRAMIGEAVPPRFTCLHGLALRGILTNVWNIQPIHVEDVRCRVAKRRLFSAPPEVRLIPGRRSPNLINAPV
jgi:DNA (cytosine-5)-methyltransferase 1